MSEEKTIVRPANPFEDVKNDEKKEDSKINFPDVMGKEKPAAESKPENKPAKGTESGVLEVPKIVEEKKPIQTLPKPAEKAEPAKKDATEGGVERNENASKEKVDPKSVYEIREIYQNIKQLESSLAGLYVKDTQGKAQLRTDKIKDDQGNELAPEEVQAQILTRINLLHDLAVEKADQGMKNPEAVIGEVMVTKSKHEEQTAKVTALRESLQKQGIDPGVGTQLDTTLIRRFMEDNKGLKPEQVSQLSQLKDAVQQKTELERRYGELVALRESPVMSRLARSEFLSTIGDAAKAREAGADAERVAAQLDSPAGRSEFMRKTVARLESEKNNSLDQNIQTKYINNPDNPFKLIQSAHEKATKGDLDGARKDLEQARTNAKKFDPKEVEKDFEEIKKKVADLGKERTELEALQKEGKLSTLDAMRFEEKQAKIIQEAKILEAFHLAKPKADLAYADFLLNADKNKDSEANRKFARDILMNLRFDERGKVAAAQAGELFDKNLERALNGSVNNQATLMAFNKKMSEYQEELKKASQKEDPEDIVKGLIAARAKADEAKDIASKINRDSANENEMKVRENIQRLLTEERAKKDGADQGKIKLLSEILKPSHQQDMNVADLLIEASKPQPDKAKMDKLFGMVKDPSTISDVLGGYQMIKQAEFQKQAINNARLAMLEIDIHLDKGENNPLVAEIENDRYGSQVIAQLNAASGTDGRTKWGDIKEATRDLGFWESAWKWLKGNIKDIAISIAAGVAGTLAAVATGIGTSWTGPGAIVAGAAVGGLTASAVSAGLHGLAGDKFSWSTTLLDGIGGASGGAFTAVRGTAMIAGRAAIGRTAVSAGMMEASQLTALTSEGLLSATASKEFARYGAWQAFKTAAVSDKLAIALGGNRFLASMTGSLAGSATYRYPTELLTGKYDSTSDWLKGSTMAVGGDMLFSPLGAYMNMRTGLGGDRISKQIAWDFLTTSPVAREFTPKYIRRNGINSWLIDSGDAASKATNNFLYGPSPVGDFEK